MAMVMYSNNDAKGSAVPNSMVLSERELTLQTVISDPVLNSKNGNGMPFHHHPISISSPLL
jgi:hypothetical protein